MAAERSAIAERSGILDRKFLAAVEAMRALAPEAPSAEGSADLDRPLREGRRLTARVAIALFESQLAARHLDLEARRMRASGAGFYTIGSAGHEGNVVLGRLLGLADPCFLHYRSAALFLERARKLPGATPLFDILLGVAGSTEDPISGGRHKVFGSLALNVPPQTSTIASHLPKSVGWAVGHERARRLGLKRAVPGDAISVCSFGDASINHAVALTAFNAARWTRVLGAPVPVLFVCEDNGVGISVRTPRNWVRDRFQGQDWLRYIPADGLDLVEAWEAASLAVSTCRARRMPVFLHLRTVRLLGHAGSDVESSYREAIEIEEDEARDPVLATARILVEGGWLSAGEVLGLYEELRERVRAAAVEAARRPRFRSIEQVASALERGQPDAVRAEAERADYQAARLKAFEGEQGLPEKQKPRHLAEQINRGLADLMVKYPEMVLFGEDVGVKGGVYHVSAGLREAFGPARVFDTLLDETAILGYAVGFGQAGLKPVAEIQYLAYYHNAEDQVRGEAATLGFFSDGRFRNPMLVRIASFADPNGFGGHFHNENSVAVFRDVPGIVVAVPSRGDDAVGMLRTLLALMHVEGRVCVFLEPIASYMKKDLHEPKDGAWQFPFPAPGWAVPLGEPRVYEVGPRDSLLLASYGNGVSLCLRAARKLAAEGVPCRVMDLRWLAPLPHAALAKHAIECGGRILIVDECRRSGGPGEALVAALALDPAFQAAGGRVSLLAGHDTYMPLGPATALALPDEPGVLRAARELL